MRIHFVSPSALLAATAALFALAAPASAAVVVVDNGPFSTAAPFNMTTFAEADDFTLSSPATFNAIRFWATDAGNPALLDQFSGTLSWFIHNNFQGGIPSTTIPASGTVSSGITITDTGATFGSLHIFELDFSVPDTTLPAGTYWLRLKENAPNVPPDGSDINWMVRSGQSGLPVISSSMAVDPTVWFRSTNVDLAYQLRLDTPEPGTLGLVAVGMAGAGLARKARRPA